MTPLAKILITLAILLAGLLLAMRKLPGLTPPLQRLRKRSVAAYYAAVLGGFGVVLLGVYVLVSRKASIGLALVVVLYLVFRHGLPWITERAMRLQQQHPRGFAHLLKGAVVLAAAFIGMVFSGSLWNGVGLGVLAFLIVLALLGWTTKGLTRLGQAYPRGYRAGLVAVVLLAVALLWLFLSPKAPVVLALLGAGWWLTMKGIPWLTVRGGRLVGLRMRVTPLTERRILRFRRIRRGYVCFVIVSTAFVLSLFLELYVNRRPLYIHCDSEVFQDLNQDGVWQAGEPLTDRNGNGQHDGAKTIYPAVADWLAWLPFVSLTEHARAVAEEFGLKGKGEVRYRDFARWSDDPESIERDAQQIEAEITADQARWRTTMEQAARAKGDEYDPASPLPDFKLAQYEEDQTRASDLRALKPEFESGRLSIFMTLHPYSPDEQLFDLPGTAPHRALSGNPLLPILGTDFEWKEVLSQLLYGFRISFLFAVLVAFVGFSIGITVGAIMGYFGGWVDIIVQRFIEIWSSIPFLFTLMILGSIYEPSFVMLAVLLVGLRAWLGITYTIRGEYYREKARDYIQAARALGVRRPKIMARHIFPNALVPVVTFMPFAIVAYIGTLVSLDYLGFGLGPNTPSWGALLRQGGENIVNNQQLIYWPILAFAGTLFCVVMVGEAVREAFDPKLYSRLR